jgi:hypothetical protein
MAGYINPLPFVYPWLQFRWFEFEGLLIREAGEAT